MMHIQTAQGDFFYYDDYGHSVVIEYKDFKAKVRDGQLALLEDKHEREYLGIVFDKEVVASIELMQGHSALIERKWAVLAPKPVGDFTARLFCEDDDF